MRTDGSGSSSGSSDPHVAAAADVQAALGGLRDAVERVVSVDLDELTDDGLRGLLRTTQRQLDRLGGLRATATGALQHRLVRQAGVGREQRAIRDTRDFLTNELNLAPSEAKRTEQTGSRLGRSPRTKAAFGAGDLSQEHAKVITDTLRYLVGEIRDQMEAELVEAARTQDPVALGRTARRLLAEHDYDAAVAGDRRRHGRRSARIAHSADGAVNLHATLYGVAGELAITAMKAHETLDGKHEPHRSAEQRAADALEQIFDVALRAGQAPAQHGVRPHVNVVVEWSELARQAGIAELEYTGPITLDEIRPLLQDASISRVLLDGDALPLEVSKRTRYVPIGLWTALKLRDKGCSWPGCRAPAGWCHVAHGNDPYRNDGKLSLGNAALLCIRHHRMFDTGGWRLHIDGPQVTFIRHDDQTASANAPP